MNTSARDLPGFYEVERALAHAQIGIDAAELHGLMIGYLSAGKSLPTHDWLSLLHVEGGTEAVASNSVLTRLREASIAALEDTDLGFFPLAPDEDSPLSDRIDALILWCHGFLAGFSLVSPAPALSDDAQEAFKDLGHIAAFSVEDDEQDEEAFSEIAEFVRVVALLIHGDVAGNTARRRLH